MNFFDFLTQWNVAAAVPAILANILLMIAFRRYALVLTGDAVVHFGAAMFWLSAKAVCRSIWWDFGHGFGFGNASNWLWNLMAIYAAYHGLRAVQMLLPEGERSKWNILTAPFYPQGLRIWITRRR